MKTATFHPLGMDDAVARLRYIMAANELTQGEVAGLCCVSPKTVESWLAAEGAANFRRMPPRHLLALSHALPGFLRTRKAQQRKAARKA